MRRTSSENIPEDRPLAGGAAPARFRAGAVYAGAALWLGACVQGSSGSEPGAAADVGRNFDGAAYAAAPKCAAGPETEADPPLSAEDKAGPSRCAVLDTSASWSSVPVLAASSNHQLKLRVRRGATFEVCIEGAGVNTHYELFIDADGSAATGATLGPWRSLGAEYKVENNLLYQRDQDGKFTARVSDTPVGTKGQEAILMRIDAQHLKGLVPHAAVAFRTLDANWAPCGWLPGAKNHATRVELPRVSSSRRAQRGVIIPVYALPPNTDGAELDGTLSPAECEALLNGDTSAVKLIETRRGDVDPSGDVGGNGPGTGGGSGDPSTSSTGPGEYDDPSAGTGGTNTPGDYDDTSGAAGGTTGSDDGDDDDGDDNDDGDDITETYRLPDTFSDEGTLGGGTGGGGAATLWTQLAEGATKFLEQSNGGDYWVAINGPKSSPFRREEDFKKAAAVWDPIKRNGGKIFGYVHTNPKINVPYYIPLCQVLADVVRWKKGYAVDGIWIDEYYPQFEPPRAAKPAGETRVDPYGGYYDDLSQHIRKLYPDLLLIGNPGAPFESDRLRYGELVDVACTFENTMNEAAKENWGGLIFPPIIPNYAQLALIHGFSDEEAACPPDSCSSGVLSSSVARAFEHGYSHLFITNGAYVSPNSSTTSAKKPSGAPLWMELPGYFETLLGEVARQVVKRAGK